MTGTAFAILAKFLDICLKKKSEKFWDILGYFLDTYFEKKSVFKLSKLVWIAKIIRSATIVCHFLVSFYSCWYLNWLQSICPFFNVYPDIAAFFCVWHSCSIYFLICQSWPHNVSKSFWFSQTWQVVTSVQQGGKTRTTIILMLIEKKKIQCP